jgi:hypothetical protein
MKQGNQRDRIRSIFFFAFIVLILLFSSLIE